MERLPIFCFRPSRHARAVSGYCVSITRTASLLTNVPMVPPRIVKIPTFLRTSSNFATAGGGWPCAKVRTNGENASALDDKARNSRRSSFMMWGRLPLAEQKLQCLRPAPRPLGFAVGGPLGLQVPEVFPPVALAPQEPVQRARVFQRFGPLGGARIDVQPAPRHPRTLDEREDLPRPEPDGRAEDHRAAKRRRPPTERIQADQSAHRRAGHHAVIAILARAELRVDARLHGVDQEARVAVAVAAAVPGIGKRAVFGQPPF